MERKAFLEHICVLKIAHKSSIQTFYTVFLFWSILNYLCLRAFYRQYGLKDVTLKPPLLQ